MLAAEISGTPGGATYSLPFQEPNTPFTSPAEEPTKNSTLLLGTSMTNSRPGCAGVCAYEGAPQQSSNKVIARTLFMKTNLYRSLFSSGPHMVRVLVYASRESTRRSDERR